MPKVGIGIVGSRFQADCIASSEKMLPEEAEVVAVASPTPGNADAFAKRHGIPAAYTDHRELLRDPRVEMIHISAPNYIHARITVTAGAQMFRHPPVQRQPLDRRYVQAGSFPEEVMGEPPRCTSWPKPCPRLPRRWARQWTRAGRGCGPSCRPIP